MLPDRLGCDVHRDDHVQCQDDARHRSSRFNELPPKSRYVAGLSGDRRQSVGEVSRSIHEWGNWSEKKRISDCGASLNECGTCLNAKRAIIHPQQNIRLDELKWHDNLIVIMLTPIDSLRLYGKVLRWQLESPLPTSKTTFDRSFLVWACSESDCW